MLILKSLSFKKKEIIVPTLTWVSDINAVVMNGFKPVFVDINFSNLSMNVDDVIKKIFPKVNSYISVPLLNNISSTFIINKIQKSKSYDLIST